MQIEIRSMIHFSFFSFFFFFRYPFASVEKSVPAKGRGFSSDDEYVDYLQTLNMNKKKNRISLNLLVAENFQLLIHFYRV